MINVDETVPLAEIEEPGLSYEHNEFLVRWDPKAQVYWAGSDGGCSCYEGFNPANYQPYTTERDIRALFSAWISDWHDGVGQEAAAWDKYHAAFRK